MYVSNLTTTCIVAILSFFCCIFRPIHDAADHGKIDTLRLLMAYGADPFITTYSGRSVVDCAKRAEAKDYINGQ